MNPYIIPGLVIYPAQEPPRITQKNKIISTVSNYLHVDPKLLEQKTRKQPVVYARQMCMYFIALYTKYSLKEIGEMFGGRDHSTVIHARQTIINLMSVDTSVKQDVLKLSDALQPRRRIEDLMNNQ